MKKFGTAIKDGFIKGIKTGFMLLKIMIPIYIVVIIFKYSPLMPFLEDVTKPAMKLFNLPPDAAVPIITGAFTDEYGVVAALSGFDFSTLTITTVAMITLCFHSIPVETAISQKIGLPAWQITVFRLVLAVVVGLFIGHLGGVIM